MYLTSYVKKFGKYTFKERPFNNVDAVILATAIYSNFEVVAPSIHEQHTRAKLFSEISSFDMTVVTAGRILVRDNVHLIPAMKNSVRFSDVGIKYIDKVFDENLSSQFYACTFEIPGVGYYIAFRGTDTSVVGWTENLNLSVKKVTIGQLEAKDYINTIASLVDGPLYVGGHSKGGNLSLYGCIHCDKNAQDRIVKVYSCDGNGLRTNDFYTSPKYLAIKDRIVFIKPRDSVVGEIMYAPKDFLVVKSKAFFIFQHDSHSWKINAKTGDFKYIKANTKESLIRHRSLKLWLKDTEDSDKELMISFITKLLGGSKHTIFYFLFSPRKINLYLKAKRQFSKEEFSDIKKAIRNFMKIRKEQKIRYKNEQKEK